MYMSVDGLLFSDMEVIRKESDFAHSWKIQRPKAQIQNLIRKHEGERRAQRDRWLPGLVV